jgi:hypothetical protein
VLSPHRELATGPPNQVATHVTTASTRGSTLAHSRTREWYDGDTRPTLVGSQHRPRVHACGGHAEPRCARSTELAGPRSGAGVEQSRMSMVCSPRRRWTIQASWPSCLGSPIFLQKAQKAPGFIGLASVRGPNGRFSSGFLHRSVGDLLGDQAMISTAHVRLV